MRIEKSGLEKLVRDLKRLRFDLLRDTSEFIVDLSKSLNESYTRSIDELVYDQYEPIAYKRTLHLRGAHGALIQSATLTGDKKKFEFYIDENSVDPVDGQTWKEKADAVEAGYEKMYGVDFNRPFISETQHRLEWETNRLADALIRRYEDIISRVGR